LSIQITEYIDVRERAVELGCNPPTGLALLPRNYDIAGSKDDLVYEGSTLEIRTLWRQARISETQIEKEGDRFPHIHERYAEWIGPVIFISASVLSQDPHAVSVALGVLSNYLTDFFKGVPISSRKVKLSLVVEDVGGYKRIDYEGNVEGLARLPEVIREIKNHE